MKGKLLLLATLLVPLAGCVDASKTKAYSSAVRLPGDNIDCLPVGTHPPEAIGYKPGQARCAFTGYSNVRHQKFHLTLAKNTGQDSNSQ